MVEDTQKLGLAFAYGFYSNGFPTLGLCPEYLIENPVPKYIMAKRRYARGRPNLPNDINILSNFRPLFFLASLSLPLGWTFIEEPS